MKVLLLEDNKDRIKWFSEKFKQHKLYVCETVDDFRKVINKVKFKLVFLDHDLGDMVYVPSGMGTGYEAAEIMSRSMNKNVETVIHSWNPAGALNMNNVLPHAKRVPFGTGVFVNMDIKFLDEPEDRSQGG